MRLWRRTRPQSASPSILLPNVPRSFIVVVFQPPVLCCRFYTADSCQLANQLCYPLQGSHLLPHALRFSDPGLLPPSHPYRRVILPACGRQPACDGCQAAPRHEQHQRGHAGADQRRPVGGVHVVAGEHREGGAQLRVSQGEAWGVRGDRSAGGGTTCECGCGPTGGHVGG